MHIKHLITAAKYAVFGFILCLCFSLKAHAGQAGITFTDLSSSLGDEINIRMAIRSEDGTNLADVDIMLNYTSDLLEFVSATDSDGDGGAGSIRVHGASNGAGTSDLTYNLRFRTIASGVAYVTIANYEIYDTAGEIVTINHEGTATINISAEEASNNASLSSLEVYPGDLTPDFSADNLNYAVTVGSNVSSLSINALAQDAGANVSIDNNADFIMGNNTVTVRVVAEDGTTSQNYTILVSKIEGGPEADINESADTSSGENTVSEGVQLLSSGKTITIINPDESVEIPEGLMSRTITIDGQAVQGWVSEDTDDTPEYCVVYGINEDGEENFYRYDMLEKSIQRYFADTSNESSVTGEEYDALLSQYEEASQSRSLRLIIIVIMAAVIFVLIIFCAYLLTKNRSLLRSGKLIRFKPGDEVRRHRYHTEEAKEKGSGFLQDSYTAYEGKQGFDFKAESNLEVDDKPGDETQVIKRRYKRRRKSVKTDHMDNEPNEETKSEDQRSPASGINDGFPDALTSKGDTLPSDDTEGSIEDLDV